MSGQPFDGLVTGRGAAIEQAFRLWADLDELHLDEVRLVSSAAGYTVEVGGALIGSDITAIIDAAGRHRALLTIDLDQPLCELHFEPDE